MVKCRLLQQDRGSELYFDTLSPSPSGSLGLTRVSIGCGRWRQQSRNLLTLRRSMAGRAAEHPGISTRSTGLDDRPNLAACTALTETRTDRNSRGLRLNDTHEHRWTHADTSTRPMTAIFTASQTTLRRDAAPVDVAHLGCRGRPQTDPFAQYATCSAAAIDFGPAA